MANTTVVLPTGTKRTRPANFPARALPLQVRERMDCGDRGVMPWFDSTSDARVPRMDLRARQEAGFSEGLDGTRPTVGGTPPPALLSSLRFLHRVYVFDLTLELSLQVVDGVVEQVIG